MNDDPLNQTTAPGLHNTNFSLPRVSHDRGDFSNGFGGLTTARDGNFETPLDEGYNSENIANRNVGTSASYVPTYIPTRRPVPNAQEDSAVSRSQPLIPHVDQHASNVADWNIVRNDDPVVDSRAEAPHPLKVKKRSSNLHAADTTPSDVLKHDNAEMRDASWSVTPLGMERSTNGGGSYLDREVSSPTYTAVDDAPPRLSLDKPLPLTPLGMMSDDRSLSANSRAFGDLSGVGDQTSSIQSMQDSAGPFNLDGVDVKKEPDTVSVHEYQAPAITHEKILAQHEVVRQ